MEEVNYLQAVLAFGFVIGLILLLTIVMRRFDVQKMLTAGKHARRLKIQEVLFLDNKRRLVLVRKDNKEHLILLGASNESVIESHEALGDTGSDDASS